MKKLSSIALLLAVAFVVKAQDLIVTGKQELIPAYRLELGQTNIYYQLNETDTATILRMAKADVKAIHYADGRLFDPNAAESPSKSYGTVAGTLEGRRPQLLFPSNIASPRSGKVVIKVWVDREGKVTKVFAPANGSTITDAHIVKQLKLLAHQAEFTPAPEGPKEQMGEIIYSF